jgi:hypothetical protein
MDYFLKRGSVLSSRRLSYEQEPLNLVRKQNCIQKPLEKNTFLVFGLRIEVKVNKCERYLG